jgi:hypothetical protein
MRLFVSGRPVSAFAYGIYPWGLVDESGAAVLVEYANGQVFPAMYRSLAIAESRAMEHGFRAVRVG